MNLDNQDEAKKNTWYKFVIRIITCMAIFGGWKMSSCQHSASYQYPNYRKPILIDSFSTQGYVYHYEKSGEAISIFYPDSLPNEKRKRPEDILSLGGSIVWHPQVLVLSSHSPFYNRRKLYNEFNIEHHGAKVIRRYALSGKNLKSIDMIEGLFFLSVMDLEALQNSLSHFYPLKRYKGLCYIITSVSEL